MNLYIKVGSVTIAQRGLKILRGNGYKVSIKRIENIKKGDGCGYQLVVAGGYEGAVKLLEKNSIKVKGVEQK